MIIRGVKKMERICGNCVFCLIAYDGERLCSLASNEYGTKDEDDKWIAGRLVHPEDVCIYPEDSGYLSFYPVEPMVNMARAHPGWCRKPSSRVLAAQEAIDRRKRNGIQVC